MLPACVAGAMLALGSVEATAQSGVHAVREPNIVMGAVRAADESRLIGVHIALAVDDGHGGRVQSDALTDADGVFRFAQLPDGEARLIVRRLGFRPETLSVQVPQLPGGPVVVLLERVAQPLAAVMVRDTATRRAPLPFERRRSSGFGHYITRADIERENPQRTTELLRRIPGVSLGGGDGAGGIRFRAGGGAASRCEPVYFLDGSPLGSGSLDLDAMSPSSIEAIEVYNGAATVPAALRTAMAPGGCGAIAVWSRRADLEKHNRSPSTVAATDSPDDVVARGAAFTADQVDLAAIPLPWFSPRPAYPDSLRNARIRGQVVAEFVVDERGWVAPETVGIVSSTHPLFAEAVRDAIAGARFSPAYNKGHVVRQVVQLPVVFDPGAVAATPR